MAKEKFRFNPETLQYDRISHSFRDKFFSFFAYFSASVVLAVLYLLVFSYFFDLPREKVLKREVNQLNLQYEILNKQLDQIGYVLDDIQNRDDNIYRIVFNADPIPKSIRTAGFGGVNRYTELEGYENSDLIIETARRIDILKKQLYVQSISYDEVIDLALNKEDMLASIPSIQPVAIRDIRRIGGYWGWRIHPIYKIRMFHEGMDFTAPRGTDVYATGNGVVARVINDRSRRGYGTFVDIDHGYGYRTRYAHLDRVLVRRGQEVKRGDVIGLVGNTGASTAPHLHYEVIKNNRPVDPVNYFYGDLSPEEFDAMIEMSMQGGSFMGY
ncbi:MAG: M23 family metallopeptidase [Marinilabiliales bacterium]|nr:MAG: M23 family metallopeptidase [Marinilabiliales bacterium]